MLRYPNLFGEKPEELAYGFDDFCTYYDSQFCYRIEQFTPARWTGYISWHDWGQRESSLWGLEPSRLIANAIAHMQARQDFGRLQRFGDWIHLHETDPELYGQNLKELCARVNGFNLYAKSQHRLVFDPLDNAGGVTLSSNSISNASPVDLAKPLTAKLAASRAVYSSEDNALASLIAMAKGFAPEKAPIKGNFEDTKYMTASAVGKVADALKNVAVGLGAGASQIDSSMENGTSYSIPLDDYVPPRRHRGVEAEYHYPHKAAVLHDRVERATRERDLAMEEGKPQSTVAYFERIRAEAQAELNEMESVAASPLPNRHENPAVSAEDKESFKIPPSIGDITELPETTGGIAAVEIDDSPYTTPAVPSEGWSTIYPDTSDEMDGSLVFSTSHEGGDPGSPVHKAEYQEKGGTSSYERWSITQESQSSGLVPGGGLQAHEDAGGHLLLKHVGQSEEALTNRLAAEPKISGSSSFYNRATAEDAVSQILDANQAKIANWLNGSGGRLRLDHTLPNPTGISVTRGSTGAIDVSSARVILVRDPSMPTGYKILTGFPTKP